MSKVTKLLGATNHLSNKLYHKLCCALSSTNEWQPILTLIHTLLAVLPILKDGRDDV